MSDCISLKEEATWIPCNERMPDPKTLVIASYNGNEVEMAYYDGQQEYEFDAWMPLPKPYKGANSMSDLISRQWLIKCVNEGWIKFDTEKDENRFLHLIRDIASPVEAVQIIRCKNCKHFDSGTDEDGKLFFKCLGWVYGGTNEDDFCSHGERKDG